MSHSTCCVIDCTNNGKNSKCKFYSFPRAQSKIDQREKWITAVRRINPDGSPWQPKLSHSICSAHFIKNEKSNDPLNPSYVPTIFPVVYKKKAVNIVSKISRHTRFMKKREKRKIQEASLYIMEAETEHLHKEMQEQMNEASDSTKAGSKALKYKNEESQVNIAFDVTVSQQTFICNRYMYTKAYGDAETQTDIDIASKIIVPSQKKCHDKKCSSPHKNYVDQSLGPIFKETSVRTFSGFSSVKNDEQLLGLAGVTRENFNTLLSMCCTSNDTWKVLKKDRLLIFLIKMKTGLTFSAIIVLFGVHRVTISRIFFSILQELYSATADMVLWPEKHIVKATVPQCFYPDYIDNRVIIDCTEFRIEVPPGVNNKVFSYSHYKKGFTAKVLIGSTPAGFISFKSKVAGGRKSDSQLTIESGLIDLLEDEDKVLADKGFPEIKQVLSEAGKNITVVMPPFLENKEQFNQQQTEATYSIASVRIHVERIMQRLKTYQILNKIPVKLFNYIDAILHICCVLVNLQPPIISNHTDDNK